MTQLSKHFTLDELTRSTTALRRGIDNKASPEIVKALTALCVNVLEPVRAHFKAPVKITSGYRSPTLNRAVGGSSSSDHCFGRAADFTVVGFSNYAVCRWIAENLDFKQLIYEFGESGWVHCAYMIGGNDGDILSAKKIGGKTRYVEGLKP